MGQAFVAATNTSPFESQPVPKHAINSQNGSQSASYLDITTSIGKQQVLYCPHPKKEEINECISPLNTSSNVIYFGGDIQDFEQYMIEHNTFDEYGTYSLDSVSTMLRLQFPDSNQLIIRPTARNTHISIFSNFIPNIDNYGQSVPSYKNSKGCRHLMEMLQDPQLSEMREGPIDLIGFSRGVNVLNQLLYETDPRNTERKYVDALFERVRCMYFLDGGNGAKGKTLPVDDQVISNFIEKVIGDGFQFHIYGTNYQWSDQRRPWIGKEMRYFVDLIKMIKSKEKEKMNGKQYLLHHHLFEDEKLNASLTENGVKVSASRALYRHFELLRLFGGQQLKYKIKL